ncbi:unnamed protein product, partial [Mesorhabditis belari]|uniref:Rho GTPase-activating protein 29/45 N-terminal domain-containing protein n=1 Tax=Mesorhabditis belari TaxID=2138241 RepID=A0AAF3EZP5_9BILA
MSSTSSICSSTDPDISVENRMPANLRKDVERFSVFLSRLRTAIDFNQPNNEGDSQYLCVHSALEMVSESIRDLFKHSQFKTNQIIVPSLQLVQGIKDLKFDHPNVSIDCVRILSIVDQLETAVLSTLL